MRKFFQYPFGAKSMSREIANQANVSRQPSPVWWRFNQGSFLRSAQTREFSSTHVPGLPKWSDKGDLPVSHQIGFCRLFWPVEQSASFLDLSRSSERCGTSSVGSAHSLTTFILPNPRSINQTKALLDKLSPRASRNQYSQSISQAKSHWSPPRKTPPPLPSQ